MVCFHQLYYLCVKESKNCITIVKVEWERYVHSLKLSLLSCMTINKAVFYFEKLDKFNVFLEIALNLLSLLPKAIIFTFIFCYFNNAAFTRVSLKPSLLAWRIIIFSKKILNLVLFISERRENFPIILKKRERQRYFYSSPSRAFAFIS